MSYYFIQDGILRALSSPPLAARPFLAQTDQLLPPRISDLHRSFRQWGEAGYSPGELATNRIWLDGQGNLAFAFAHATMPPHASDRTIARDLAAWLVLLDKWMETFVVVARARSIWTVAQLGAALPFVTPIYLPLALLQQPPDNWQRLVLALASAVVDGPLRGEASDQHWSKQ